MKDVENLRDGSRSSEGEEGHRVNGGDGVCHP